MHPRRLLVLALVLIGGLQAATGALAEPLRASEEERERTAPLLQAVGMDRLLPILREEGMSHARDLEAEMFPGRGRARWPELVGGIYDTERMGLIMLDEIAADTEPWDLEPLTDFFDSELGRRIVDLEISARQAMLDPSVEEASQEYLAMLRDEGGERLDLLEEFASVNDLVDLNVTGALNANFAFFTGLNKAGAFTDFRGEEEMLQEIWAQEPEIRLDTELWVMSFLALAYQPLSDAEFRSYVEFSQTPAGRHFNINLFAAFNELFQTISNDLGMAAAQFMTGEDL